MSNNPAAGARDNAGRAEEQLRTTWALVERQFEARAEMNHTADAATLMGTMKSLGNTITRQWWNLERFGMTPLKLCSRVSSRSLPKVLCNCIPKSGTHLLERMLCLHPQLYRRLVGTVRERTVKKVAQIRSLKPGQVLFSHLPYQAETAQALQASDVRSLFMVRDLRDILVSDVHYVRRNKRHLYHEMYSRLPDLESCLEYSLRGDASLGFPSFGQRMQRYMGWLDSPAHLVRFEDLIGPSGGGDDATQLETMRSVFLFLGLDPARCDLEALGRRVFSRVSPTFRAGRIGGSRAHFDGPLKQLFKQEAGELLVRLQYETDENW